MRCALAVVVLLSVGCGADDGGATPTGSTASVGGNTTTGQGGGDATSGGGGDTTAGSGGSSASGGNTGGNNSGGGNVGGGGAANPGDDNPDGLPEVSSAIYSRDYASQDAADITSTPNIATAEWGAAFGYGPGGGWRLQPDPIVAPVGQNENSAGWAWGLQAGNDFPVDGHDLVTVSYMFNVSGALLQEIALAGNFWAHDQKVIDFKYHDPNAPFGEGNRNTIHFGESNGEVRFSHVDGGGGNRIYFGPDWLTLADEWVWLCHVIDMRGQTPAARYVATYMKRSGDAGVTRIGIRYEDAAPVMQTYNGRGIWGFLSPFHGYWDDMLDRNGLSNDLAQMFMSLDRLRVMAGWPDADNGPPNGF